MKKLLICILFFTCGAISAAEQSCKKLKLSPLYSHNMVLQRDSAIVIAGVAGCAEAVSISIGNQRHCTIANNDGRWSITLEPLTVAENPYTLTISTKSESLNFNNILAGEVWLCSGQSNMVFMMRECSTAADIADMKDDNIRLFDMKPRFGSSAAHTWKSEIYDYINRFESFVDATWNVCDSLHGSSFSAVAYYFAKMLRNRLDVPVGLICNAVGGSPTETWIDNCSLKSDFPEILENWHTNELVQDWVRGRIDTAMSKKVRHPFQPSYLFNAGVLPLDIFPIKGVLWYQGESNAHNIEAHEKLFKLLVAGWRKHWRNDTLPLYYVQLSSIERPLWEQFRDSQRRLASEIPYIAMAVSSDVGDSLDVHPKNKQLVGERLARQVLVNTYNKSDITPCGPMFRQVEFCDGAAFVYFDFDNGMHACDGGELKTFELAGSDKLFYAAKAQVTEGKIKVYSNKIKNPQYVRYGWRPFTRANLVNSDNLPASTFCSY